MHFLTVFHSFQLLETTIRFGHKLLNHHHSITLNIKGFGRVHFDISALIPVLFAS
jgi:hypothetical protein